MRIRLCQFFQYAHGPLTPKLDIETTSSATSWNDEYSNGSPLINISPLVQARLDCVGARIECTIHLGATMSYGQTVSIRPYTALANVLRDRNDAVWTLVSSSTSIEDRVGEWVFVPLPAAGQRGGALRDGVESGHDV